MTKKTALAMIGASAIAVASVLFGLKTPVKTQTTPVLNPTQYSFVAPADYDLTFADGTPRVASITTEFYDGAVMAGSLSASHPAKDANGKVTIGISRGSLALDKQYTIVARAVNAFDTTPSDPSIAVIWSNTKPGKPGQPKPCVGQGANACP